MPLFGWFDMACFCLGFLVCLLVFIFEGLYFCFVLLFFPLFDFVETRSLLK